MAKSDQEFTDAIMLLRADHQTVKDLFARFQASDDEDEQLDLVEDICNELKIHAQIEEEIFYPAFRGKIDDDMLNEAVVEHDGAKVLINDLVAHGDEDPFFEAKVTVLCEEIAHHVEEEEMPKEGMFAQCRATDVDLVALLDQMQARKQELQELAASEGLPPAELAAINLAA